MNKIRFGAALGLLPFSALAHEGHGGLGLFHHAVDMIPTVLVVAVAYGGWRWLNKR